ncbi:MAG: HU family DNA-binding protein [Pseudonocardiaceae bacterium]
MNKAQLIDALAVRLGDKKMAAAAVAALVDVVVRTVNDGDRVTITGFGVFEKRARAARTARNPRTGEAVTIQQTDVPAFRPGTVFREVVSGTRALSQAGAGASASRRPVTRVTEAGRLTAVRTATEAPKTSPKVRTAKPKVAKETKPAKVAKKKAKTTAEVPAKITKKKAAKKSATKKLKSM